MCGIVGAVAQRNVCPILIEGLKRLEYRGYDSAGVAIIDSKDCLEIRKTLGKVAALEKLSVGMDLRGNSGIAHTRWATHGEPSTANAHPHQSNGIAIVHNGIIENHENLRDELIHGGYTFLSETDSEVIAHLVHSCLKNSESLCDAVMLATTKLEGAFALAVVSQEHPGILVGARSGSPFVVGVGVEEWFVASDQMALRQVTDRFVFLEDGDIIEINSLRATIFDKNRDKVQRQATKLEDHDVIAEKGKFRHYMQKEIFEQASVLADTTAGRISEDGICEAIFGYRAEALFKKTLAIHIVACGTSFHAGLVARYWIEENLKLPCLIEVASEYRYREVAIPPDTLFITISQSGETADTLACLSAAKDAGYLSRLGICNVPSSSLARESDLVFLTKAGPEIGVASTKAFTTQLVGLLMLTLILGRYHGLSSAAENTINNSLRALPESLDAVMSLEDQIIEMAEDFDSKEHALFLGRGIHYPVAMEGALKLKEISYIHAEAYPAGELKHGPLALVDSEMPVVAVAPNDDLLEKLQSNLEEVRARGGKLYVFGHSEAHHNDESITKFIELPQIPELIAPLIYSIPLQLLAYHVAILKGTDIDQPRNLAKSVTVE
mgnify:CR=1 FL=1